MTGPVGVGAPAGAAEEPDERRDANWDVTAAPGNYASLVTAQVVSSALAFAAIWMATRLLGVDGYGGLVAILAAGTCVGQLAIQWSAPSLLRFGTQEFVETGRVAAAFRTRSAVLGLVFLSVSLLTPLWFPPLARVLDLAPTARVPVLAFVIATGLWVHVQYTLQAAKLPRLQALLLVVERVVVVLALLAFWVTGRSSAISIAVVYVVTPLIMSAAGLWQLRRLLIPAPTPAPLRLREMLQFSLPFVPASIVGYFSTNYFDAMFITHYRSTAELGRYNLVFQIAGMAMQLPLLAGSIVLPLFVTLRVSGAEARMRRFLDDVLPFAALVWSTLCAIAVPVGVVIIPIVFGPDFARPGTLLWPLMAAAGLAGPVLVAYGPLAAARVKPHAAMMTSVAAALTNTVLNVLWIPRFGLPGCAWATTAGYAAALVVAMIFADYRPIRSRLTVVAAPIPALAGALVALWAPERVMPLVAALSVAAVIAVALRARVSAGLTALRSRALPLGRGI